MFKGILVFCAFFIHYTKAETNCNWINPEKPSDCRLSQNDIAQEYKYCCYEGEPASCYRYTQESFQLLFDVKNINRCSTQTKIADDNPISYSGCESVTPRSKSDCVLNQQDKDAGAEYCCYFKDGDEIQCTAETKESYEAGKELIDYLDDGSSVFDCNTNAGGDKGGSGEDGAGFINLSFIYFIFIILLIL